jgi:hypothetical protein
MANPVIDTQEPDPVVIAVDEGDNVVVTVSGEGPRGATTAALDHLAFNQNTPSSLWTIQHNLGKFPSVTVFDSAKTQIEGDVTHINNNELTINFGAGSFAGVAYLN